MAVRGLDRHWDFFRDIPSSFSLDVSIVRVRLTEARISRLKLTKPVRYIAESYEKELQLIMYLIVSVGDSVV